MDVYAKKGRTELETKIRMTLAVTAIILTLLWIGRLGMLPDRTAIPDHRISLMEYHPDALRLTEANGLFCAAARTFSSWIWV